MSENIEELVWTADLEAKLISEVKKTGNEFYSHRWKQISFNLFGHELFNVNCRQHWHDVTNVKKRGDWSPEEDFLLLLYCETKLSRISWTEMAKTHLPDRSGKQCRERWMSHLRAEIIRVPWTNAEDNFILMKQALMGNKWSAIAKFLPGRTELNVRNRWYTNLSRLSYNRPKPRFYQLDRISQSHCTRRYTNWTEEEDQFILKNQAAVGNRWALMAKEISTGRTASAIKNRWQTLNHHFKTRIPTMPLLKELPLLPTGSLILSYPDQIPIERSDSLSLVKDNVVEEERKNIVNSFLNEEIVN